MSPAPSDLKDPNPVSASTSTPSQSQQDDDLAQLDAFAAAALTGLIGAVQYTLAAGELRGRNVLAPQPAEVATAAYGLALDMMKARIEARRQLATRTLGEASSPPLAQPAQPVTPLPLCTWCGRPYSQHEDERAPGTPVPKVPCLMLKSRFAAR